MRSGSGAAARCTAPLTQPHAPSIFLPPAATFITKNLIPATLGNIIGGAFFVGIVSVQQPAAVLPAACRPAACPATRL